MKVLHATSATSAVSERPESFGQEAAQDLLSLLAEAGSGTAEAVVPELGATVGPGCAEQMVTFFRGLSERIDFASFEVRDFIARGAEVVSFGTFSGRLREEQRSVASDWAIHWRVEAGRLRMGKAYVDTLGRPAPLAA